MLRFGSKLVNLAVSSQDCTRKDLRRSKIQNFPGDGPPDPPMWRAVRACTTSRLARYAHVFSSLKVIHLHLTKLKLLPTALCRVCVCVCVCVCIG